VKIADIRQQLKDDPDFGVYDGELCRADLVAIIAEFDQQAADITAMQAALAAYRADEQAGRIVRVPEEKPWMMVTDEMVVKSNVHRFAGMPYADARALLAFGDSLIPPIALGKE
jgi:hypothetical protein